MSTAIWFALRDKKTGQKRGMLVGYSLERLMKHLKKISDKMNWDNYGGYWVIDHIKAKSLFNYTSPDDSEFKQCWSLKNLQPLEKIENIKKRNN